MSKKNLGIIIAIVIIFLVAISVLISTKPTETETVNTTLSKTGKEKNIKLTKQYGDTVSKIMNLATGHYQLIEQYTSYYDADGAVLFDYDKENINYDSYIVFETYKNDKDLIRIVANRFYKTGDEKLYSELYFEGDNIYYLVNDENRGEETYYGYVESDIFYIFDADNIKLEVYENNILLEQIEIKEKLLNKNNKTFDDFSSSLIDVDRSDNLNDFVPEDYEMLSSLTVDGFINKDEEIDTILVMQKKTNYEKSDGFYAYPRIATILVKDEDGSYILDGYLSNLIAPLSSNKEIEDSFKGFKIINSVIISENHFIDPYEVFYINKYRKNDFNRLQLIGYTKGFEYEQAETNANEKYFVVEDFNLLTGKVNVNVETINLSSNQVNNESVSGSLGKKSIYYSDMMYNSDLEALENIEKSITSKNKK